MKSTPPFCTALALLLVGSGCATNSGVGRYVGDVAATGAGFVAGDQLSGGNKAVAFGSGAVALGLKRFIESKSDREKMAQLDQAFKRGMAQETKLSYLAIQNAQRDGFNAAALEEPLQYSALPISVPERTINGVRLNATHETIQITTR